ncbi:hypothetical protein LXD69_14410 [Flavobacterium sediminilitoris]|uniref:Uncharacterized protein n=1 Tax=Flavobacterium sediminilitoris TaxID=2024526 RepID=A0ABY4HLQ3_9FLAO|nr:MULTISPECIES: hypothetical protein [Flavobacterium]UOX33226.1 hypothetical protein LXD69_14410 [Flavobacterium sediminilitoris]
MQILDFTATTTNTKIVANTRKGVQSIVLYSNLDLDAFTTERIQLEIERNGQNSTQITKGFVNLKKFVAAATYGDDAISSFPSSFGVESFKTVAVIELAELGAISLAGNDQLTIVLDQLVDGARYVIDGVESPFEDDSIYLYEDKTLLSTDTNAYLNTVGFETMVLDNDSNIKNIWLHYENGKVTKHSLREFRAISQDIDPVAYVKQNGQVLPSFPTFLQYPLKGINGITIDKEVGSNPQFLFRYDHSLVNLGIMK